MPHVGDHVVVLDPRDPGTGTVVEVRFDGGRVRVEHDGLLAAKRGHNRSGLDMT